jgi:hypothetical protein
MTGKSDVILEGLAGLDAPTTSEAFRLAEAVDAIIAA